MTNTYKTGNPLGSTAAKDLSDNSSNFDEALNSPATSFSDRFSNRRQSWAGFESQYADLIAGLGYVSLGDYRAGINITTRSQSFLRDGIVYALANDQPLPYTTTGVWADESSKFKVVGDGELRADLANKVNPGLGASLVGNATVSVKSMAELLNCPQREDLVFNLRSFLAGYNKGGDDFIWSPSTPRSQHDGATVVSPTVPFTGSLMNLQAFLSGTGETQPLALGCFVRIYDELTLDMFGAAGGVNNDAIAFNKACQVAVAKNVPLHVPGRYNVAGSAVTTGRLALQGGNTAQLTGNVKYLCTTFPPVADTLVMPTIDAPYFSAYNLAFKAVAGDYALQVQAQLGTSFIDTVTMEGCNFYGALGFRGSNLIGGDMALCTFYNTNIGIDQEGCTNWTYNQVRFRQAAQFGFIAQPTATGERKGGENHKFVNCEWAVCATGARLIRSQWASFETCLFDYCGLPVWATGSLYQKYGKTYFGASLQGSLQQTPGYAAPPTVGTAFYSEPWTSGGLVEPFSWTAIDCEYTNYSPDVNQPLINSSGFSAVNPSARYSQKVEMFGCKLLATGTHSANSLMSIVSCTDLTMVGVVFDSFNRSTSMVAPFTLSDVDEYNISGTDTSACYQDNVRLFSPYERETLNEIITNNEALGLLVKNKSGAISMVVRGVGGDRIDLYAGGALRTVGVGAVNSGGSGFRQLIVPN